MHRQLLKMLFAYQLEGFLALPGGLQEATGEEDFALLNDAPQGVMPYVVTAGHLFGLLHHGEDLVSFPYNGELRHAPMWRRCGCNSWPAAALPGHH